MNGRWKRYPEYRPCKVDWPDIIPDHWQTRRLRFVTQLNPVRSQAAALLDVDDEVSFVPMEAVQEWGGLNLNDTRPLSSIGSGYTWFQDDDVIVAKITPCFENAKGALARSLKNGCAFGTTELHVIRTTPGVDPRFIFYLSMSHPFRHIGASAMYGAGGQKRVPESFIRNYWAGLPPPPEQVRIATFLDRETQRIDALIAKKEEQIRLLWEKRGTAINQMVTRGLDASTPRQSSKVEFLGAIPSHWDVLRLKYAWQVRDCKHVTPSYVDDGYALVSTSEVKPERLNLSTCFRFVDQEWYDHMIEGGRKPRRGDIVYSRNASLGAATYVDTDQPFVLGQDVVLITSISQDQLYLYYVLNASVVTGQVSRLKMGSTLNRINVDDIRNLVVPVPPPAEQAQIAHRIDELDADVRSLTDALGQTVTLLHKYRQSLITAAVTGQIDVRDEVPA